MEDDLKHTKITQVSKTDDMELQLSVFIYYNLQNNFSWHNCFLKPHYYQAQTPQAPITGITSLFSVQGDDF